MREYLRGFRLNIERTHDYCYNNHDYSNVHLNSGNSKTEQPTTLTYADRGTQTSNTVATYSQQTQPEKKRLLHRYGSIRLIRCSRSNDSSQIQRRNIEKFGFRTLVYSYLLSFEPACCEEAEERKAHKRICSLDFR